MSKKNQMIQNATTVGQLKDMIEDYDDNTPVFFSCNYGDYHNTQQALFVSEADEVDSSKITESAYSHSGLALSDPHEDFEFWCKKCEQEMEYKKCPKCGSRTVDETGEPSEGDDDESTTILILK